MCNLRTPPDGSENQHGSVTSGMSENGRELKKRTIRRKEIEWRVLWARVGKGEEMKQRRTEKNKTTRRQEADSGRGPETPSAVK